MTELKLISIKCKEILFSFGNEKYIGSLLKVHLASDLRSSCMYNINELIIQKDLPKNLEGVKIEYLFEEKEYHIKWVCYFSSIPSESDEEVMSSAFGYVLSSIPNISNPDILFQIEEKYLNEPIPQQITDIQDWIFIRP